MFLLGPAYWIAIVACLQVGIARICARNTALRPWTMYVHVAGLVWCLMALLKRLYLDEIFPPADALYHEEVARDVAERLSAYRFAEAFQYFGIGNPGYRFLLGVFYSITTAPEWVVYTLNGALGFWGMVALLELLCLHSGCRTLRGVVVFSWLYLPTGLQWTTANLKEGPVLWGAAMMLYWTLPKGQRDASGRGVPLMGMLVLGFLRPHIAIIWMVSINLMSTLRSKRFGLFFLTGGGVLASAVLLSIVAPEMFNVATNRGVSSSLGERYEEFSDNDSLMSSHFVGQTPIPVWTGVLLILFRPWPTEVRSAMELAAGAEVWLLGMIGAWGWYTLRDKTRHLAQPSVLVMLFALVLFGFFFSYMYNMGLMVRQRLMAYPTVLYLYAWPYVCAQKSRVLASRRSRNGRGRGVSLRPPREAGVLTPRPIAR